MSVTGKRCGVGRRRHYTTTNPFMVTSNECYGMSLPQAAKRASYVSPIENDALFETDCTNNECDANLTREHTNSISNENGTTPTQHDLSFLFSRESDRFGEGIPYSDSALSQVFREKESDSMNKRRKNSIFVKPYCNVNDRSTTTANHNGKLVCSKTVSKEEVHEILSQYNHNPKQQNPLYATTANEFGLRKPSAATYTTARYGLSQKFSQSFNRTMYRDEGLNASMTKSRIHDQLTPQFI